MAATALPFMGCGGRVPTADVVVMYQTDWCGACHAQEPGFQKWGVVSGVDTVVLDVTNKPRAVFQNKIRQYPTYIYYRGGHEIYRTYNYSDLYTPE